MKSIFWKYLSVTVSLLLVSFVVFGATFLWQTYNYTLEESQQMLEDEAVRLSRLTTLYVENDSQAVQEMYFSSLSEMIMDNDAKIVVCNTEGQVVYYLDEGGFQDASANVVSPDAISTILNEGSFSSIGSFDGSADRLYFTCGQPLISGANRIIGAVFISSPATVSLTMLDGLNRIFLVTAFMVLLMAFIVSYFVAQTISKPLKKMSVATRAYAKGDFSVRVAESGNDEITELAHSLNQMSESLEQLDSLRSSFIANVSHELKTPMTTITGFVDGILDGTIPPDRQREYLVIISNETRRLARLVIRMLDASRLQSGEVQMKPIRFDLAEMLCQTVLGFEQRINEKNINVEIAFESDTIYVMADQDNINQVVYNLIDNATKFTTDGGTLLISASLANRKTYVKVQNEGQTIAPNVLPHIFDRFYKADQSRGNDRNGAGLGLFLCKQILTMHGENIHVSSENGVTEFVFTLPLAD